MMKLSAFDARRRINERKNKDANKLCDICNKLLYYNSITSRCKRHKATKEEIKGCEDGKKRRRRKDDVMGKNIRR